MIKFAGGAGGSFFDPFSILSKDVSKAISTTEKDVMNTVNQITKPILRTERNYAKPIQHDITDLTKNVSAAVNTTKTDISNLGSTLSKDISKVILPPVVHVPVTKRVLPTSKLPITPVSTKTIIDPTHITETSPSNSSSSEKQAVSPPVVHVPTKVYVPTKTILPTTPVSTKRVLPPSKLPIVSSSSEKQAVLPPVVPMTTSFEVPFQPITSKLSKKIQPKEKAQPKAVQNTPGFVVQNIPSSGFLNTIINGLKAFWTWLVNLFRRL